MGFIKGKVPDLVADGFRLCFNIRENGHGRVSSGGLFGHYWLSSLRVLAASCLCITKRYRETTISSSLVLTFFLNHRIMYHR